MSSYDNNSSSSSSNFHHHPNAYAQQGPPPHALKDNAFDNQPRFYTSPVVVQQPSYLQMNPPNGQYTLNQSVMYPPPGVPQSYPPPPQQNSQNNPNQYFESIPVNNNYLLMPNANGANAANSNTPNPNSITPSNTSHNNSTPIAANNTISGANYYNTGYGQYHVPVATSQIAFPPQKSQIQQSQQNQSQNQQLLQQQSQQLAASEVQGATSGGPNSSVIFSNFPERLQALLPAPPLSRAGTRPDLNLNIAQKRAKRKSKFSKAQDELIVSLKKKGKSWVEIAEISGVGSYLAARNRYQVIVGQQGNNNSSSWDLRDKVHLQQILDAGEIEKWRFISTELNKATNKNFTDVECRDVVRYMFWSNPGAFGVNEDTINECVKEKKMTEKSIEQRDQQYKKKGELGVEDNGNNNLVRKRKSISSPELKKEASASVGVAGSTGGSSVSGASGTNTVNSASSASSYYGGGAQTLPHPYQRGYSTGTAGNSGSANQYTSYPKQPYY
ncbi:uncharacterized protein RJT20DRAFT_132783 [Scheffersomyces xylosifermentans]|uniref:uncharacterized protein n=1 Tax=Scheffersomyces xylosifermentans TaxID=1304137 RepID=UPI00315CFD97